MRFEENTILFGSDPTPGIVAIEMGDTGTVKVYRREKDGTTVCEIEPFHPFLWADGDVTDLGIEAEKLTGDLKFGCEDEASPAFCVQAHLVTPGPDVFVEARDHTLAAALGKAMKQLADGIKGRVRKRLTRSKSNLGVRRGPAARSVTSSSHR